MDYNREQQVVIDRILDGENVCMMGPGGTGKSTVIKNLHECLPKMITLATTGVVSLSIGGGTICNLIKYCSDPIHWCEYSVEKILDENPLLYDDISECECLCIDEMSMVSEMTFTKLAEIFSFVRKSNRPFGGVPLLISGDFAQIPPIDYTYSREKHTANYRATYHQQKYKKQSIPSISLFNSPLFKMIFNDKIVILTKNFRSNQQLFSDNLNILLNGNKEQINTSLDYWNTRVVEQKPANSLEIVYLNKDKNEIDQVELGKYPGLEQTFKPYINDELFMELQMDGSEPHSRERSRSKDILIKQLQHEKQWLKYPLKLKVGSPVMNIRNNPEFDLANGHIGTVVATTQDTVKVRFAHKTVIMGADVFMTDNLKLSISHIPLTLLFSSTVHKIQGQTISTDIYIDPRKLLWNNKPRKSIMYTILSRVKTIEQINLATKLTSDCFEMPDGLQQFYDMI